MKYKYFGKTGIQVSALSFGTMTFGGDADEATSEAIYKKCREAGINLFDCANVYADGRSEEILGRLIQHERKDIILTTKCYFASGKDVNDRGLSRRHIYHSLEASLRKLKTEYVDIFFLHHFDEDTPLEESLRALHDLVAAGNILYIGLSNFAAWQIVKAIGISALHDWPAIAVIQPMYNLLKRQAEVEILPMALAEKLAVIPYNPLAGGFLSGKYSSGNMPKGARLEDKKLYAVRYFNDLNHQVTDRFIDFAKQRGFSPVALAIAWTAAHPAITSPLLGARSVEQLTECLKALEIDMTPELRNEISALSPAPPLATDRNDELLSPLNNKKI